MILYDRRSSGETDFIPRHGSSVFIILSLPPVWVFHRTYKPKVGYREENCCWSSLVTNGSMCLDKSHVSSELIPSTGHVFP